MQGIVGMKSPIGNIEGNSGLWTQAGKATLGADGDTITVSGLTLKKYVQIIIAVIGDGLLTYNMSVRFNGDSGTNYVRLLEFDGGVASKASGQTQISPMGVLRDGQTTVIMDGVLYDAEDKVFQFRLSENDPGNNTVKGMSQGVGIYINATALTSVTVSTSSGATRWKTGSSVQVLHHD